MKNASALGLPAAIYKIELTLEKKMIQTNRTIEDIKKIFNARSIAIVGASEDLNKFGGMTMDTIIKGGYQGRIYPVNPKADTVQGLRAYHSIDQIPDKLDAVVVIVPAKFAPDVVSQAAAKGARGAIVLSAGFREAGNYVLEEELFSVAQKHGIRLLGPNIQGINYLPNKLCAIFFPVIEMKGPIAVVSQSGSITTVLCEWAADEGFGISAAVNLGNQTDICESDYIDFFAQDENTKATVMYLESIKNGRNFINTLRKSSIKKPVCIFKSGRTEMGARTATSHTGSMSGSYEAFNAACRQFGAIVARDLGTLYDQAKALATIDDLTGRRVAIISSSGGANSVAVDEAEILGLNSSRFSKELVDKLKTLDFLPLAKLDNPVDLGSVWGEHYRNVGLMIDQYEAADIILMNFADPVKNTFEVVSELAKSVSIPVAVSFMGGGEEEKTNRVKMQRSNIPVFSSPARAMRGIQAVVWRSEYRRSREGGASYILLEQENDHGTTETEPQFVLETEAVKYLERYDIPYPANGLAHNTEEALTIAEKIGYPVVLKVVSKDVTHKSDVGGVAVGLENADDVADEFRQIQGRVKASVTGADIQGLLVCKQSPEGLEVIIGAHRDSDFGHIIMFGLGGIHTEVYKDVTFRIAPLEHLDAEEMVREIKGYPLLAGVRGHPGYDVDALARLLLSVSQLVTDRPGIQELDLNPVRVFDQGLMALDVRIIEQND